MRREFRGLVSIVAPCFNEAGNVDPLHREIVDSMAGIDWELILVDDGSADETFDRIRAIAKADSRIRGSRLSRNFGHQAGLAGGLGSGP